MGAPKNNVGRLSHGHSRKGKTSPTYYSWQAMLDRVKRNRNGRYGHVTVCDRWLNSFDAFLADMGERPEGCTLDRIDTNSGYAPSNCRWATPTEQARNTRKNVLNFDRAVEVARRRLSGESCRSIAADLGISENLPREIVKGRCWKDALAKAIQDFPYERR